MAVRILKKYSFLSERIGRNKMKRKLNFLMIPFAALIFVVAGSIKGGSSQKTGSKEMLIGEGTVPDHIDIQATSSVRDANGAPYDSLMQDDHDSNLLPTLVTDYDVSDDGLAGIFNVMHHAELQSGEK